MVRLSKRSTRLFTRKGMHVRSQAERGRSFWERAPGAHLEPATGPFVRRVRSRQDFWPEATQPVRAGAREVTLWLMGQFPRARRCGQYSTRIIATANHQRRKHMESRFGINVAVTLALMAAGCASPGP